jgi:hypothetical protein
MKNKMSLIVLTIILFIGNIIVSLSFFELRKRFLKKYHAEVRQQARMFAADCIESILIKKAREQNEKRK